VIDAYEKYSYIATNTTDLLQTALQKKPARVLGGARSPKIAWLAAVAAELGYSKVSCASLDEGGRRSRHAGV
jgi:hypothetical protein